jgi:FMN phosphatase YigB (HAD superfamily)
MPESAIEVVLFDLGGVLFDFGGVQPMKSLSGIEHDDEIWRRWLACRWVRTFERGSCSAEQFAKGVVGDWALPITPDAFLHSFRSWLGGPLAGADVLVREARNKVKVGCLSNTNTLHWTDQENRWELLDAFDFRFLSFQMGYVKPDREIFDRAAQLLNRPRDRVLFLDDNAINVEGARAAGFHAMRAVGVDDARRCLVAVGVLSEG